MGTAVWEPYRAFMPWAFDTSRLTAWEHQKRKEGCVIEDVFEKAERTEEKSPVTKRIACGKTYIIVKEHFPKQGKTLDELLTDVMLEKAKRAT